MNQHSHPTERERGAALVTALIFLVVLMTLGTTSVMNNTLQERMAANARNRDLAFQAAEHALDAADSWMITGNDGGPQTQASLQTALNDVDEKGIRLAYFDSVTNIYLNDDDYWRNTFDWESLDLRAPDTTLTNVHEQPKYVVEKLPGYTGSAHECDSGCAYYRVTALGFGGVEAVDVILQTLYRIK